METSAALEWINAFEFVIALAVIVMLSMYVWNKVDSWKDFWFRTSRFLSKNFQGGPYDMAVSLIILFIGKTMRAVVIWEWGHFGGGLNYTMLILAISIISLGMLATIRVLAPVGHFNWISITVAIIAATVATVSILT